MERGRIPRQARGVGERRQVDDAHGQPVHALGDRRGRYLDAALQVRVGAAQRATDMAVMVCQALQLAATVERERARARRAKQLAEACGRNGRLPLDRLLPGMEAALVHVEHRHRPPGRLARERDIRAGCRQGQHHPVDHLEKARPYADAGIGAAAHQAFDLHRPRIAALRLGIGARIHAAKGPALPVLHRRRAVGIQHVALVQHRLDHALDRAHGCFSSTPSSRPSMACSQPARPRAVL